MEDEENFIRLDFLSAGNLCYRLCGHTKTETSSMWLTRKKSAIIRFIIDNAKQQEVITGRLFFRRMNEENQQSQTVT